MAPKLSGLADLEPLESRRVLRRRLRDVACRCVVIGQHAASASDLPVGLVSLSQPYGQRP